MRSQPTKLTMSTGRREFLQATSAGVAAVLIGCGSDQDQSPLEQDAATGPDGPEGHGDAAQPDGWTQGSDVVEIPEATGDTFGLGIATGDVLATSALAWTRYSGARTLRLVAWDEESDELLADAQVTVTDGGFVHAVIEGLPSGRWLRYAFVEIDAGGAAPARSRVGRFRAALADDSMEPLSFGASACTFGGFSQIGTLEHAGSRTDLDLFLLLGDTSYNDGASSLASYRDRWQGSLRRTGYMNLRAATSLLATWDDHEVGNNWSPETIDPEQLASARSAFFDNLPLRRVDEAPDRVWRKARWGRTAEFFVLDSRSERRPSTRDTDECTYLSREQMDWLQTGLAASPAVFKIILNSVPIGSFPNFNLGQILLDPNDRWEGYARARQELLSFIESAPVPGVVFLSGDFHLACAGRAAASGTGSNTLEILAGPGAQVANPLTALLHAPQFDYATSSKNYAVLRLDPAARRVGVAYHDSSGNVMRELSYTL